MTKRIAFFLGVLLLVGSGMLADTAQTKVACVALVMALWWVLEVLPLGVTALVPVFAFPFMNIMSAKQVAPIYMSSILMIFIGGFLVAIAMQRWQLHRRIALHIIAVFGNSPQRLILGFMLASSLLSMWVSNTATTVMMVSIALAVIKHCEDKVGVNEQSRLFASTLMLAIAYAASVGGIATLVGTPPNLVFARIYEMNFNTSISFGEWIVFGLPTAAVLFLGVWLVLIKLHLRRSKVELDTADVTATELQQLGRITPEEKKVAVVFVTMALLWIFRKGLNFGVVSMPGWSALFPHASFINDGTVAILCAAILFALPARDGKKILDGDAIGAIPWQAILLFGGGFALAKGIQDSGLGNTIGNSLQFLGEYPSTLIIASCSYLMIFFTELTSNTASTELVLPILAAIAKEIGIAPLAIMIPVTLAASCAFMLPAATPPNAIIFASQRVKVSDMIKCGCLYQYLLRCCYYSRRCFCLAVVVLKHATHYFFFALTVISLLCG